MKMSGNYMYYVSKLHGTSISSADGKSRQRSHHTQSGQKSLIKRKDILDKIQEGQRLLEEEERLMQDVLEEEEEPKELGEYTFADLQKNISNLTVSC